MDILQSCRLCPRQCGVDRSSGKQGYCGADDRLLVARAALHFWEEPCISGTKGSGTVFFSGCPLGCRFCQNYEISARGVGKAISIQRLADIFLELQDRGANNINLVSPTQYVPHIIKALELVKARLSIPVVYNTGGYERVETLKQLEGYVDIWLSDAKYADPVRSKNYSAAQDYPQTAFAAIAEMLRQCGTPTFDENGMLRRGVIVRHLVLPGGMKDSFAVLDRLAEQKKNHDFLLSLMAQYTPYRKDEQYTELNRRISSYEYRRVCEYAQQLGFEGFQQERSSAKEEYTPDFDLTGV
ncbi:MAG: radical SAM protein [Oscillospiraceae bacterium]|nr:radical SAM protein [Oscillospiraceae bacterium]